MCLVGGKGGSEKMKKKFYLVEKKNKMIKNCVSINLLSSLLHEQITYKKKQLNV